MLQSDIYTDIERLATMKCSYAAFDRVGVYILCFCYRGVMVMRQTDVYLKRCYGAFDRAGGHS